MKNKYLLVIAFLYGALPWSALCFSLDNMVCQYTLDNGFTLLVVKRNEAPVVSFSLCYRAGAVDESSGSTGTAHLLEHMLFKGTPTIGTRNYAAEEPLIKQIFEVGTALDTLTQQGNQQDDEQKKLLQQQLNSLQEEHNRLIIDNEIDALYSRNGAEGFNASTGFDVTTYVVSLPANRLELWARIESERFSHPVFRQYFTERNVVLEELRQSYESRPERLLLMHLLAVAFLAHPYGRPIIGWPSDIQYLSPYTCEAFFRAHYTPDKAVAAIVGDLDPDSVYHIVRKYFGSICRGSGNVQSVTAEPEQNGERRVTVEAHAQPLLIIAYHKPTLLDPDDTIFDVIDVLLTDGRSSRLYKKLVIDMRLASSVTTVNGFPGARYSNLFLIKIVPEHCVPYPTIETAVYEELSRLAKGEISSKELATAKKKLHADLVRRMESNAELANLLSYYQSIAGDWRYLEKNLERIQRITPADIQAVAKRYFRPSNRTVATLSERTNDD